MHFCGIIIFAADGYFPYSLLRYNRTSSPHKHSRFLLRSARGKEKEGKKVVKIAVFTFYFVPLSIPEKMKEIKQLTFVTFLRSQYHSENM